MAYDIPSHINNKQPEWEEGIASLPVRLNDGRSADLPIHKKTNALIFGVTGTGKTKSFTLPAAKALLAADPQMKGVFFEIKKTFIDTFMRDDDKVVTYNASIVPEKNVFRWNMIKEIRQSADHEAEMKQIAEFLFSDLLNGADQNRAWIESAMNTFIAVLRTIVDCFDVNITNYDLINSIRNMSVNDLLSYISKHPRNHSLLMKDFGYDVKSKTYTSTKRPGDVMFFLNSVLEKFGGTFESRGEDTIYDYLHGKYGRNLFMLYDLATAESARPFLCYFLKKIKDEKMSLSSSVKEPILWSMDEVDKLADGGNACDFGLYQAATLGREYGIQILLSTQSIENLFGLSPSFNTHIATGGLSGFPVIIAFRPGDPTTVSTLQTLFGSERKIITTLPLSRYDHPTVKSELEPIVTDSDFASLKTGQAYVKIKDQEPQKVYFLFKEVKNGS